MTVSTDAPARGWRLIIFTVTLLKPTRTSRLRSRAQLLLDLVVGPRSVVTD